MTLRKLPPAPNRGTQLIYVAGGYLPRSFHNIVALFCSLLLIAHLLQPARNISGRISDYETTIFDSVVELRMLMSELYSEH